MSIFKGRRQVWPRVATWEGDRGLPWARRERTAGDIGNWKKAQLQEKRKYNACCVRVPQAQANINIMMGFQTRREVIGISFYSRLLNYCHLLLYIQPMSSGFPSPPFLSPPLLSPLLSFSSLPFPSFPLLVWTPSQPGCLLDGFRVLSHLALAHPSSHNPTLPPHFHTYCILWPFWTLFVLPRCDAPILAFGVSGILCSLLGILFSHPS